MAGKKKTIKREQAFINVSYTEDQARDRAIEIWKKMGYKNIKVTKVEPRKKTHMKEKGWGPKAAKKLEEIVDASQKNTWEVEGEMTL